MRAVYEHTGLNFYEIEQMPFDEYYYLLREAVIYNCNKTESGREYLNKCWIFEQTKPDKNALRDKFGNKGEA